MVSLDKAMVAHYKHEGETYEIMVDPDAALAYRLGQKKDLANVLAVEEVFKDARRGERHKAAELQKAFHSQDIEVIADIILKKGELSLTTEQKRKMMEQKRSQIAALIAREATDPRTGAPHPLARIEQAMENVRLDIDPFKEAAAQMDGIISALRPQLPIKLARRRIAVRVGPAQAQRVYGLLKSQGIEKEEWTRDGGLVVVLSMPAGLVGDFYDRLNKATGGEAQTKQLDDS